MAKKLSRYDQLQLMRKARTATRRAVGARDYSMTRQLSALSEVSGYAAGQRLAQYATGASWTPRGSIGGFVRTLLRDLFGSANVSHRDVLSAINTLRESGFTISPGGAVQPPPVVPPPVQSPASRGRTVTPPPVQRPPFDRRPPRDRHPQPPETRQPLTSPQREAPPEPPGTATAPQRQPAWNEPPLPGDPSPFGQEILSPQSSNVYSFSFVPHGTNRAAKSTGTLFVTFKANKLNAGNVSTGKGRRGGLNQLRGRLGGTVSGKTNERGPMYAYLNVPTRLYQQMVRASSKGKFVWDNLRIRGTVYGHKFTYQLVSGSVTIQDGVSGTYIPRRATRRGFAVRSVATVGTGRRGFQSSTLPGQRGHRTRRR